MTETKCFLNWDPETITIASDKTLYSYFVGLNLKTVI